MLLPSACLEMFEAQNVVKPKWSIIPMLVEMETSDRSMA